MVVPCACLWRQGLCLAAAAKMAWFPAGCGVSDALRSLASRPVFLMTRVFIVDVPCSGTILSSVLPGSSTDLRLCTNVNMLFMFVPRDEDLAESCRAGLVRNQEGAAQVGADSAEAD